jgi:hypothetical protein
VLNGYSDEAGEGKREGAPLVRINRVLRVIRTGEPCSR